MKTTIYNHWSSESISDSVGHIDGDGIVYDHWSDEIYSNKIGRVDRDGVVYKHWNSNSISDSVGHIDGDGIIYDHWSDETYSNKIGHVDKSGIVYNHWRDEYLSNRVGHIGGGNSYAAGAALLLLLSPGKMGSGSGSAIPDTSTDWQKEQADRAANLKRLRDNNAYRQKQYKVYAANPKIVAAAQEYANERVKKATILTLIFFIIAIFAGLNDKDFDAGVILKTVLIFGTVLVLPVTLFIRRCTKKDAFSQKVWELGEQGYGKEDSEMPLKTEKKPKTPATKANQEDPVPQESQKVITVCPHCGAKCRIPAVKGTIQITCPNPDCKKLFTYRN